MKIKKKQQIVKKWFFELQKLICNNIEELEKVYGSNKKFKKNKWKYGEFRTIKGEVIEKGGVAFSNVVGKFSKEFAKKSLEQKIIINFGLQASLLYCIQKIQKFLQCILTLGLFVQKNPGLEVVWM